MDVPRLEPGKRYVAHPGGASSAVRDIAYDTDQRILEIEYPSGERYAYEGVPPGEFIGLLRTDSLGTYVNDRIKRYPCRKL